MTASTRLALALSSLAALATLATGQINCVKNGSFEQNSCQGTIRNPCMKNWTVVPSTHTVLELASSRRKPASDGSEAVVLDDDDVGYWLTQTVATSPNRSYVLMFDVAADRGNNRTNRLALEIGNLKRWISVPKDNPWVYETISIPFTATGEATLLRFRNEGGTQVERLLFDNVRVFTLDEGASIGLSGDRSYVEVPHNAALAPPAITVEAWVLQTERRQYASVIRKNPVASQEAYSLRIEGDTPVWAVNTSRGVLTIRSNVKVPLNVPTHIACTYQSVNGVATSQIFINGNIAKDLRGPGDPLADRRGPFLIGQGDPRLARDQFVGRIDEVRVWRRARTQGSIRQWMRKKILGAQDQVATYRLDRDYRDSSGGNHGRAVGSPRFLAEFASLLRASRVGGAGTFGTVITGVGDFNDDGYEDFGIGQPSHLSNNGHILIFSGKTHSLLTGIVGTRARKLGSSLAKGDFDGDGKADVLSGAPGTPFSSVSYFSSITKNLVDVFSSASSATLVGGQVAAGRLDADAYADAVFTRGQGQQDRLAAYSMVNNVRRLLWDVRPVPGVSIRSIAVVDDLDDDGRQDVLIGMPGYKNSDGRYEVRSGRDGSRLMWRDGQAQEEMGYSVAAIGDVQGKWGPDFAVASKTPPVVRVIDGASNGFLWSATGQHVSPAGDVDGDGIPDVLTSTTGRVFVYSSATRRVIETFAITNKGAIGYAHTNGRAPAILIANTVPSINFGFAWVFDRLPVRVPPAYSPYGTSCVRNGNQIPRLHASTRGDGPDFLDGARPRIGKPFHLMLENGRPGFGGFLRFGFGRSAVPLDALGLQGCQINVRNRVLYLAATTDRNGRGQTAITVPEVPAYAGVRLAFEWLVIDPSANRLGLTFSDACEVQIGSK